MRLANIFLNRFRDLGVNHRGKVFGHKLAEVMTRAESFSARVEQDGENVIYIFPDRSRLKIEDPKQKDRVSFYVLSNIG